MQPIVNGYTPTVDPLAWKNRQPMGKSELDSQDFLNLLVTQMKNQDPLQPMDNADFTQQTTMFSQLEELVGIGDAIKKLSESTGSLDSTSMLFSSASFIGKQVEYLSNKVELGGDSLPTIQYILPEEPSDVEVRIKNSEGAIVALIRPEDAGVGINTIQWDGTGIGGTNVPDGSYTYEVIAKNSEFIEMDVKQNGVGIVRGVEMVGSNIFLDLGGYTIPASDVSGVRNADVQTQAASE